MNIDNLMISLIPHLSLDRDARDLLPAAMPNDVLKGMIQNLSQQDRQALVRELQAVAIQGYLLRGPESKEAEWCALSQATHLGDPGFLGYPNLEWTEDTAAVFLSTMVTLDGGVTFKDWLDVAPSMAWNLCDLINGMTHADQLQLANRAVQLRRTEILEHFPACVAAGSADDCLRIIAASLLDKFVTDFKKSTVDETSSGEVSRGFLPFKECKMNEANDTSIFASATEQQSHDALSYAYDEIRKRIEAAVEQAWLQMEGSLPSNFTEIVDAIAIEIDPYETPEFQRLEAAYLSWAVVKDSGKSA